MSNSAPRGFGDPTPRIRQAIIDGALLPNERLVEQDLVVRFGANRGAIRTALAVLEQQGLVVREPNRGAHVRGVTEQEAIEIEELRCAIESVAVRHAALQATEADVAELRAMLVRMEALSQEGSLFGFSDVNVEFHARIARCARHATAEKVLAGLRSQIVAVQFRPILEPGRAEQINREHRQIVDAIASDNVAEAERAMRTHLENAVLALRAAIASRRYVARPPASRPLPGGDRQSGDCKSPASLGHSLEYGKPD